MEGSHNSPYSKFSHLHLLPPPGIRFLNMLLDINPVPYYFHK